jgi:hypothetical protein
MRRTSIPAEGSSPSPQTQPSYPPRVRALLELARDNPEFARSCAESLPPAARTEFIAALMANRPPLRPLRKALSRRQEPTELSIHLHQFARLVNPR